MKIAKSSRHSKITGDFAETLVLYWLSKSGFECAKVDHTGIDLIARHPKRREMMGISVKSRSRYEFQKTSGVNIKSSDFKKAEAACKVFGCVPYIAIVVDAGDFIRGFITSLHHVRKIYNTRSSMIAWGMTEKRIRQYLADSEVKFFEFQASTRRWFNE